MPGQQAYRGNDDTAECPGAADRFWRSRYKGPRFWLISIVCALGIAAAADFLLVQALSLLDVRLTWGAERAVHLVIVVGATTLLMRSVWRRSLERFIREEQIRHGRAICMQCGYDLRGQTEPRCPECGNTFDENLLRPSGPTGPHSQSPSRE